MPIYGRICSDFGFDPAKDIECARTLASLLGGRGLEALEKVRTGFPKKVLVCGGSPQLADELSSIAVEDFVVAADSATTVLAEAEIEVGMIVTDLDGIVEDQMEMNSDGVPVFVHAHGDNMPAISKYFPKFSGAVVGTCQCPPPQGLVNFGGFTDGDRAACISAALGASTVMLAGFDFENPSEKPGKVREVKLRKLRWAKEILDELSREGVRIMPAAEPLGNR
jgi:uncharacterized Rossmann fold enzyme